MINAFELGLDSLQYVGRIVEIDSTRYAGLGWGEKGLVTFLWLWLLARQSEDDDFRVVVVSRDTTCGEPWELAISNMQFVLIPKYSLAIGTATHQHTPTP